MIGLKAVDLLTAVTAQSGRALHGHPVHCRGVDHWCWHWHLFKLVRRRLSDLATVQCHCAAPVAERDGSLSLRDLSLVLIFSVTLVIGVCTFLFVQSLHRLPPSPKGKGRKGVFGAPLHLRDKEL